MNLDIDARTAKIVDFWSAHADDKARYSLLNEYNGKEVYRFSIDEAAAVDQELPASIIVKTWHPRRGNWLDRLKRATVGQINGCENEFKVLRHLAIAAPDLRAPVAYARFPSRQVLGEMAEVALMSDVGRSRTAMNLLSEAVRQGDGQTIAEVNEFLARSVRDMLFNANLIDIDHTLINIVKSYDTGHFHRIDFEIARRREDVRKVNAGIGQMLGALLATHAFATQPTTHLTTEFSIWLRARLPELPQSVWVIAAKVTQQGLEKQRKLMGIVASVDLGGLVRPIGSL